MAGVEISHGQAAKRLLARFAALVLLTAAGVAAAADRVFTYALEGAPESLDFAKTSTERAIRVAWLLCDALGQRIQGWPEPGAGARRVVEVLAPMV